MSKTGIARTLFAGLCIGLAPLAFAQSLGNLPADGQLGYDAARNLTFGNTLTIPGMGQSTYFENGAYSFAPENQTDAQFGFFEIRRDGKVCVDFQASGDRCDTFLTSRGLLFLLTEDGKKMPVFLGLNVR